TAAASAIGFINMLGNLGGFYGPKMVGATVDQDIQLVDTLTAESAGKPLSKEDADQIDSLKHSIAESGKLSDDESHRVGSLLDQVNTGAVLDKTEQKELIRLLNKGASFAQALRKLAIWPIMSAVIILIVGYFRRRVPVKR